MHATPRDLTLEEKTSILSGLDFWQSRGITRIGLRPMFLADGPHGIRKQAAAADHLGLNPSTPATCFPTAATVANSWDTELAERVGRHLGLEAAVQGVSVLLGPGLNIKRNPRCGRNFEYFSEDPLLTGKLAAAYVRGIQSRGVAACVKHFAGNNQETRRLTIDSVIDERTLREIYLTAFEIAIRDGGARTVMSAYNRLNGTYSNENPHLLRDILRGEWGFTGCVITDWGGSNDRVAGLVAGNELEMPGTNGESDREILRAVRSGTLAESLVDEAVERLVALSEWTGAGIDRAPECIDREAHHAAAREAAEESIVLLKNDGNLLPLRSDVTVAVIGEFADKPRYQGAGSSTVNPTILRSALESLAGHDLNVIGFERGFRRYGEQDKAMKRKACALASKADVALLYLGLDEVTEAEGCDRDNLSLPQNQIELLEAVAAANPNVVVVLACGSAIEMPWIGNAKAIVHGYLGGQGGAEAMLNVLTGKVNPSGKLAETYPLRYESVPSAANFPGGEATVEYREALYVGYRHYATRPEEVLFPFGFGLSYTTFGYSDLAVDASGADITVTNLGDRAGKEVVQLYVSRKSETVFRPDRELRGFRKIALDRGESRRVRLEFDERTFRYYNVSKNAWDTEAGEYRILIGASSADIRASAAITIEGSEGGPYAPGRLASYFAGNAARVGAYEFSSLLGRPLPPSDWDRTRPLCENDMVAQCEYAKGAFARFCYSTLTFAIWFLPKVGKRDAANLLKMSFLNMPFRGIAKMMGGMVTRPMVEGLLMVVNGHFFRGTGKIIREFVRNRKENYGN